MKRMSAIKKTLLLLVSLAVTLPTSAKGDETRRKDNWRPEWGVTAGVRFNGMSLVDVPSQMSVSPRLSYNAGLHGSIAYSWIALQGELNYGYTSVKASLRERTTFNTTVKAHNIEIPVLVSVHVVPIVRINAGPVFNIMSIANYRDSSGEGAMFGGLLPTFGYSVGAAVMIKPRFFVDVRFVGAFHRTYNQFEGFEFKTKPYSGGIKIGYLF